MSLRSPVGRVLGLGAAGEGVAHWWALRVASVALVLLGLWFVVALIGMPDRSYETVTAWMHSPFNAVMLSLLVGTAVYHSQLGVTEVVEDYVSDHAAKIVTLLALKFVHIVLGALGIFSVLRVAFGSAA